MGSREAGSELLIKRKRKRWQTAVDPCLGVYLKPSPSLLRAESTVQACIKERFALQELQICLDETDAGLAFSCHDTETHYPEHMDPMISEAPDHFEDQKDITVDDFLRNVAQTPATVYKKGKKRKIAVLGQLGPDDTTPSPGRPKSPLLSSDCDMQPRRPRRRRNNIKPLAERIYRAAVLTNVDLEQVPDAYQPSSRCRRPLTFVKDDGTNDNQTPVKKRRALTLVDPRKTSPFRHAVFSSPGPEYSNSANQDDYTLRKTRAANPRRRATGFTKTRNKPRRKPPPICVSTCPPLSFVPLVEVVSTSKLPPDRKPPSPALDPDSHGSGSTSVPVFSPVSLNVVGLRRPKSPVDLPMPLTDDFHSGEVVVADKPFKKLASLLDGFLETARNATLMQGSSNDGTSRDVSAAPHRLKRKEKQTRTMNVR